MLQWTKASHAQIRGSSLITSSCCSQFQFQLLIISSRFCLSTQSVRQANQSQKPAEGELYGSLGKPGSSGGDKVRGDCGRVRPPEQRSWTAGRLLSCGGGPFCPERPAGSRRRARATRPRLPDEDDRDADLRSMLDLGRTILIRRLKGTPGRTVSQIPSTPRSVFHRPSRVRCVPVSVQARIAPSSMASAAG